MTSKDRPVSIRVSSETEDDVKHDLLKALYIFKRINSFGVNRKTVYNRLKKIRGHRQYKEIKNQIPPNFECLDQLAYEHEVQLFFWDQARHREPPKLLHSVSTSNEFRTLNLVAPYLKESFDMQLTDLHLILDIEKFKRSISHQTQGNFWMCVEMSDLVGCECWDQIANAWGSDEVALTREPRFISFFGFGFDIYKATPNSANDIVYTRIHKTRLNFNMRYISLEFVGSSWPDEKTSILLEDQFILRPNDYFRVYSCPNEFCDYNTSRKFNLERHKKTCSLDTIIVYKQSILTDQTAREWCINKNFISPEFLPRQFACFDIESVGVQLNEALGDASKILSLQRVISVAVSQTFPYENEKTKVFLRKSSSETHYREFIRVFIDHLLKLHAEHVSLLPDSVGTSINYLCEEISEFKAGRRNYSFQQIKRMQAGLNYLGSLRKLFVYGFNSQSYDLCVLFSGLLAHAKSRNMNFDVLKRGNQILCLRMGPLVFCDCLNFSPGCNLDSFGQMWGATAVKSCFPYEHYDDISAIENAESWPPIIAFKSSLGRKIFTYEIDEILEIFTMAKSSINCTEMDFVQMVRMTNEQCQISDLITHQFPICLKTYVNTWVHYVKKFNAGEMSSMKDFLIYYNSIDTELLCSGFQNYVESFIRNFQISPVGYLTLPGLSEKVMWKQFDRTENSPYSFPKKFGHLNAILRDNLIGGLSTVFKRHVEIGSSNEEYAECVHKARNGEQFKKLVAYDANSEL